MYIYGLNVDVARGFDVFRSSKLLRHFDSYEEARAYAHEAPGRWIRYWKLKEGEEKGE
jgi:hypothetical protein